MAEAPKKKVVRVESATPAGDGTASGKKEPVWKPSEENKKKATTFRIFAWVAWLVAISLELFAIFFLMRQDPVNMVALIIVIVIIGVLAVAGNLLWKQANRLDPASKKNKTKFFIQNQLGAIMTVLAFLPLVLVIFFDKNLDGKQKALAGGLGAVAMVVIALTTGVSWDGGPSQEQYAEEENIIVLLTGEDLVYWTKSGSVFHVCAEVPDVNRESQDGQIYEGTIADAHAAGKERLTLRWESEATKYCGYSQEQVDAVKEGVAAISKEESEDKDAPAEVEEPDNEPAELEAEETDEEAA